MTEPMPEVAEEPAPELIAHGQETEPDDDELDPRARAAMQKLRRENQSLRTRMHEYEETLGAAAARETARDRAEVERIASEHLVEAADIWRAQPDIQAFYDDEFHQITRDRVVETAKALVAEKPHLARPNTAPPPSDRPIEGLRPGARAEEKPQPVTWSSALRGR